jgi:hypothetical protein
MKRTLILLGIISLAGCASSSGVVPIGQDTYMVSRQGGYGASAMGPVKADAMTEAGVFCSKNGKQLQLVHTEETPKGVGRPPEVEIQFMCLNAGDPELMRPKMVSDPNSVIQIQNR